MVLDACERFDLEKDGLNLYNAARFTVTGPTLDRLLDLLAGTDDQKTIRRLSEIVVEAPGAILRDRREAIDRCPNILPEIRRRLGARQDYVEWSGEQLWSELQAFVRRSADAHYTTGIDRDYAADLVDALGDRDVPDTTTICRLLKELEPEEGWLEAFVVDLAGRRRLREAVPALVDKFQIDTDYLLERTSDALSRIGDVEAVRLIRRAFPDAPDHFRIYSAGVLANIKHPESGSAVLELLEEETDSGIRMWLCVALCDLFSERGFDAVRREMTTGPAMTFRELCTPALAVVKVLGLDPPPEAEVWEQEQRRQEESLQRAIADDAAWDWLDDADEDDFLDEPEEDGPNVPVTAPIRNVAPRVGRNDPCPCGSGKKFKKCCGRSG
jgi:hypothetical protein